MRFTFNIFSYLLIIISMLSISHLAKAEIECKASELSGDQINEIITKERARRDDLPPAFDMYEYTVRKEGCYYTYIEYGLPSAMEYHQIFRLNQYGEIVDAQSGGVEANLKCPQKQYANEELAEIIKKAREYRKDFSQPFKSYRVYVDRLGCLYLYFEYNQPERRGDYQVFTIDPFGEVMDYSHSNPY